MATNRPASWPWSSPFEDRTGVKVEYEGTRDLNALLTTGVQGGNPPDAAGLPGPGPMAEMARAGKLVDLSRVLDESAMLSQYSDDWRRLGQVDGKQVGIFIKSALKGQIWYNPKEFQKAGYDTPETWDELMALSDKIAATGTTPWCIGLEAAAANGWPGTDGNPLFGSPPRCYLHHQASFITDFFVKANPRLQPGEDFNFFPFPDIDPKNAGAVEVAGDRAGRGAAGQLLPGARCCLLLRMVDGLPASL